MPTDRVVTAERRYAAPVTTDAAPSAHEQEALAAIAEIEEAKRMLRAAEDRRDAAVFKMYDGDGRKPSQIAGVTGMSTSNVRRICEMRRWRGERA